MALNFRRSLVAGVLVTASLPFLHGNKKPAVLQLHLVCVFCFLQQLCKVPKTQVTVLS